VRSHTYLHRSVFSTVTLAGEIIDSGVSLLFYQMIKYFGNHRVPYHPALLRLDALLFAHRILRS
jgi:hypothetical protein